MAPSVHRVLQTIDLVVMIVGNLDRPSMARLARTSKAFFTIPASRLWSNLDKNSVACLLGLLPIDQLPKGKRKTKTVDSYTARFGALQRNDVSRLRLYGQFVRSLKLDGSGEHLPEDCMLAVLRMLASFVSIQIILPNLESIECSYTDANMQIARMLLSPSVRRVEISDLDYDGNDSTSSHFIASFLDWLPDTAPSITRLHLRGDFSSETIEPIAQCLDRLPDLENVAVDDIHFTPTILKALAGKRNLSSLYLGWVLISPETEDGEQSHDTVEPSKGGTLERNLVTVCPKDSFRNLRALRIQCPMDFCKDFLLHCTPSLAVLQINCALPPEHSIQAWLSALKASSSDLYELAFSFRGQLPPNFWVLFRSLFELDLEVFLLNCENTQRNFSVTDEDMSAMAEAWSNLRRLSIFVTATNTLEPTLAGILPFAEHCADLNSIAINRLAARADPCIIPSSLASNPSFSSFEIRKTSIQRQTLARFIGAVWPNAVVTGLNECGRINDMLGLARDLRGFHDGTKSLELR